DEWAELLQPDGKITMRNTPCDALMIGLWVKKGEEDFFVRSGFDGFYTYFGATDFTYGSAPANWHGMQAWAVEHKKIFIPCVGPGYIDTRVRPWNGKTARDRDKGKYYDDMFKQAIDCKAPFIGITSFNEWHEGTQIEPAVPFRSKAFRYLDYSPLAPDYYLARTAYWVSRFAKTKK
ncbi:MAG: alpha-mannosidase, partial [Candidatus Nephrothrix sp. EaCA]